MYSQRSLVIILYFINLIYQCESRTISDGSETKDLGESDNKTLTTNSNVTIIIKAQLQDAEKSVVKRVETAVIENETENSDGKRRVQKLWNELGKTNDREKRGLLNGPYSYNLGPVFPSSGEYDSDGPPTHHGHKHKEYYYPPPQSPHEVSQNIIYIFLCIKITIFHYVSKIDLFR